MGRQPQAVRLFLHRSGAVLPGAAEAGAPLALVLAMPVLVFKLAIGGALLAFLEGVSAKMRTFPRAGVPATAFMLAVIGLLVSILLGVGDG